MMPCHPRAQFDSNAPWQLSSPDPTPPLVRTIGILTGLTHFSAAARVSQTPNAQARCVLAEKKVDTENEIDQRIAFFETPLGRMMADTQPAVALETLGAAERWE